MARKSSNRCLSTNVKIKMEGRPPPDDPDSSSMPDVLQESFAALTIGGRRKENVDNSSSKEDEISLQEDHDFQDVNFLEKWNSMDRITVDGSESSEWERSVSSSMSWFDESEQDATLKVKSMLDSIENMLYGDIHTPLPKPLVEECNQWRQRFPHLRVVGTGLRNFNDQETEGDLSNSDNNSPPIGAESLDYSKEQAEEGEEEVYASHGTLDIQPVLSHEFQHHHEPIKDPETDRIKELLLNELTTHVWKEVVLPTLKPFIDKHIRKKDDVESSSSKGDGEPCRASATKNQHSDVQDVKGGGASTSLYPTLQSTSLSAREMRTVTSSYSVLDDPFECYRRYSEQFTYCDSKFSDEFGSLETVKELGQSSNVKKEVQKLRNFSRSPREGCHGRLSCGADLEQRTWKRKSPRGERLQFLSPRAPRRLEGVVEELKPLEKSNAWVNSRGEGLQYSGKYLPPKQTRHLALPAIEHGKVSPNVEVSSIHHVRASSAFPKIMPKNFRPTMSSNQNKAENKGAVRKKHHSKYNEADPLESEVEVIHKSITRNPGFYSGQLNNIQGNKTRQNKQKKKRKSNRTPNMDCDHS